MDAEELDALFNRFIELLPTLCDAATSFDPDGWMPENPLWAHCAVIALVAQDVFGGELLRASLEGTPYASMHSHYWNRLPNGIEVDFSASQFGEQRPTGLVAEIRDRCRLLSDQGTRRRYRLLSARFSAALQLPPVIR